MTPVPDCRSFTDVEAELALGVLDGAGRAAALAHLEGCSACQVRFARSTGAVDRLLAAGPSVTPPPGFEGRVMAAIAALPDEEATVRPLAPPAPTTPPPPPDGDEPPAARHRGRGRVAVGALLAAAAVILAIVVVSGSITSRDAHPTPRVAAMIGADGAQVGKVEMGRSPATVLVALPGWYEAGAYGTAYRLQVGTAEGETMDLGPLTLEEGGMWSGPLPVDPAEVRSVVLYDMAGRPMCHADLRRA